MKKTYLFIGIIVSVVLVIVSCQKNDSTEDSDTTLLNLKAPSGMIIAKSLEDLNSETAVVIGKRYGAVVDFTITNIDYLPIPEGYACTITYKLFDGFVGRYSRCYFENYKIIKDQKTSEQYFVVSLSESKAITKVKTTCSGSCGCTVESEIYSDHIKTTCSCSDCTMEQTITTLQDAGNP